MEGISVFEKRMRLATSLSMLTIEKTLVAIVVPLINQWEWATTDSPLESFSTGTWNTSSTTYMNSTTSHVSAHQIKASPKLIIIFLAYSVLEFILCPLSGVLGDKFGLDCVALAGTFLAGVICIVYAFVSSLPGILIARLLQGVCSAFVSPTSFARLAEAFADDDIAVKRVMNCATATTMFSFFGPGIAGITFQYFGLLPCFMSLLAVTIVTFVGIAITFRHGHIIDTKQEDSQTTTKSEPKLTLLDIIKDFQIQAAVLLMATSWLPRTFLEPTLSLWITNTFNGGPAMAGIVYGTAGVSVITSSIVTAQVAVSRPNFVWLYGLTNILGTGILLIVLPLSSHPAVAAVAYSLCIYASFCVRNTLICLYKPIADTKFRSHYALVMGVFHMGITFSYVVGPPVAIPLFNDIGFQLMCIVVVSLVWTCSPLFLYFRKLPSDNNELNHLIPDRPASSRETG